MDLGIAGRRALVCGGSRGLGRAAAEVLARAGVHGTIAGRTEATLREAAAAIPVATVVADVTTQAGRDALLVACPAPDILVTNSDGPHPGDFRDHTREDWLRAVDELMISPIELIRRTVDGMAERRFGRIVNIVSRSVKIAQPDLTLSNGARSGLVGFTAGIARQFARHDVTINNLLPGPFDTDAQDRHIAGLAAQTGRPRAELRAEREAATPARRFGRPDEFGHACAFLCSVHAGFITAQNILIDGGGYPGTF